MTLELPPRYKIFLDETRSGLQVTDEFRVPIRGGPSGESGPAGRVSYDPASQRLIVDNTVGQNIPQQPSVNTPVGNNVNVGGTTPVLGTDNVVVGVGAATNLDPASSSNAIVGNNSLPDGTTTSGNVIIGDTSGQNVTTGTGHVIIGTNTTGPATGDNTTLVGAGASVSGDISNATAIGAGSTVTTSDTVQLGRNGIDNVIVGNDLTVPGNVDVTTINGLVAPISGNITPSCNFSPPAPVGSSLTPFNGFYQRIGDIVSVSIKTGYILAAGTTTGDFTFTVPVNPTVPFASSAKLGGVILSSTSQVPTTELIAAQVGTNLGLASITFPLNTGSTGIVTINYWYTIN